MILLILRILMGLCIAFYVGKLVSKVKLPAILGWLLTGMILGPHALGILNFPLLNSGWYHTLLKIFETAMGLMIGTELVLKELKRSGKQIIITTIFQSMMTFVLVTLCFGVIFYFLEIPLYIALIFGAIALATAPAPALAIVKEFKADGPVTRTLIPMAVLDDIVAIVVFFSISTGITAANTQNAMPLSMTLALMILLPLALGAALGFLGGLVLKKERSRSATLLLTLSLILLVAGVGFAFDFLILAEPAMNYMLLGMAFSAVFANLVSEERLAQIMNAFSPMLELSLMMVILNLGAPLDYHLILGAGLFTAIYIVSRGIGKYSGAYLGSRLTKLPKTVEKYLGLTLLPHSGVSLIFTGIAVTNLNTFDPSSAAIVQGTIAAAAVINEIIAVVIAKKAFEWAGELEKQSSAEVPSDWVTSSN